MDWVPFGETIGAAGEVADLGRGVEAEPPEECRGQVGGGDGVEVGVGAELVAGAEDGSAADSAAGQDDAEAWASDRGRPGLTGVRPNSPWR